MGPLVRLHLVCAAINGAYAVQSAWHHDIFWLVWGAVFCVMCNVFAWGNRK